MKMKGLYLFFIAAVAIAAAESLPESHTKTFESSIFDLQYVNHKLVLAVLSNGKLFKSTDGGNTWSEQVLPTSSGSSTKAADIHISPSSAKTILIHGNLNSNWWSKDGGATWTIDSAPVRFSELDWHQTEPGYFLGLHNPTHVSYVTTDYGKTYNKWYSSAVGSNWGDAGVDQVDKSTVYGMVWENNIFNMKSTSDGQNYRLQQKNTFTAVYMQNQIFTLSHNDQFNDFYLRVTPDVGKEVKQYFRAEFPWGEDLEEKNLYSILDDSTGAVFMGINHQDYDSRWGHLYVSEPMGVQYVFSLGYMVHTYDNFDFMRVRGAKGILFANSLENPNEGASAAEKIRTYVSFNNGAWWDPLAKPAGVECPPTGACYLNLHGWRSIVAGEDKLFGPFYSADTAIGIVVGNGNVGEYLSSNPNDIYTVMSSDGGVSFKALNKGPSIYEIGDHGGIIVWAPINQPTKKIYYTKDYGKTVKEYSFTDRSDVWVWNIISEDQLNGTSFLIMDQTGFVAAHIDFKSTYDGVCNLGSDYEDYVPWHDQVVPTNGLHCLMGEQVTYRRRKDSSNCYSPDSFDQNKVKSVQSCLCTEDDFECDFGYKPRWDSANHQLLCDRDDTVKLFDPPLWCKPGRKYNVTQGYRLEAGNGCRGGVDKHPKEKDCPGTSQEDSNSDTSEGGSSKGSSNKAGWVAVGIMIPIVLLIIGCAFVALNNEKIRERLPVIGRGTFSWGGSSEGYDRPGGSAPALFDDEEYIIGNLDDRHSDEEEGMKNVDLGSPNAGKELEDFAFDPETKK
ncbi:hypothetical protein PROFUN_13505 [Planoprotostelium fungivorum]|uniref:VPS10 domain-containing protein n=1 Tax=Planoprotostelium fungivorum TaxID=1890364 RepID=A0A2P6N3V3_9EUKA|nr:hypothetical protein PROFUN_13505 [Planoprotostelium fungivorum]